MLKHKKLLIDKHCPMCKLYGKCFVKLGLIEKMALSPYQTIEKVQTDHIDMERARNEIAFYDYKSKATIYGLDAMIEIASQNLPFFKKLLKSKLCYPVLLRLYRFISYNRKVIYPSRPLEGDRLCQPDVNEQYRYLFLFFAALFAGFVLDRFALSLSDGFGFEYGDVRAYAIALGFFSWQLVLITCIGKPKSLDYWGNLSTVAIIGAMLLSLVLLVYTIFVLSPWFLVLSGFVILGLTFLEYGRRCELIE